MRRRTQVLFVMLLLPIVLVFGAIIFITQTDVGRERVRRLALSALDGMVVGEVRIGAVEGNLLRGIALVDVSIMDTLGRPFIAAERISARYGRRAIFGRRIELGSVRLERPVIVLDRRPDDDKWNFQKIFPTDEPDPDAPPGWGSWVRLYDIRITDGRVVVRIPWSPEGYATEAARQQAIDAALAGEGRQRVVQVQEGLQQIMDFRNVNAELPRILIADPERDAMLIEVAALSALAEPFLPPAAEIRNVQGTFRIHDDSLWFRDVQVNLPDSDLIGGGTYYTETGDLALRLVGNRVTLGDIRWIYPRLPAEGGGPLDLILGMRGGVLDIDARTPGLRIEEAGVSGRLALGMANDRVIFRGTSLQFTAVDTRLIEQLVPDVEIPRRGRLGGRAALDGPMSALRVDADVTFDDAIAGRNRVLAAGEIGVLDEAFRARDLRLRLEPVQVELARAAMPDLPLSGTVTGTAVLNGTTTTRMAATINIVHRDRGAVSSVSGRGALEIVEPRRVELDLRVHPLSLTTVGRFVPAVEMHGDASGTIRMTGTLADAVLAMDLALPAGGALEARGRLALDAGDPGYDVNAVVRTLDLSGILRNAPPSSISATFMARGRGLDPETSRASIAFAVTESVVDGVVFEEAEGRLALEDGLLILDTLHVSTGFARATAAGSFGLVPHQQGELRYLVEIDSLSGFARWMPARDTGVVEPSPRAHERALAEARREIARLLEEAEIERAARALAERRPIELPPVERGIARDTIAGSVLVRGTASGHTDRFQLRGDATAFDVIAMGNALGFGRIEYAVSDAPARDATIVVGATLDSVRVAGFAFDTVHVQGVIADREGELRLSILQEADIEYVTQARFELRPEQNAILLDDLRLRFDTTVWTSVRPAALRWGPAGIVVDSLDLRSGRDGRIYVHGVLPTADALDMELDVHRLDLAHAVALFQREATAAGVITVTARATGSPEAPVIRGAAGLVQGTLRNRLVPDLRASFSYADETLVAEAEALSEWGELLAVADARVPVNLALVEDPGPRFPARALEIDIRADSLPLDALPALTDAIAELRGQLYGEVTVRGTVENPEITGEVFLDFASFMLVATGVRYRDVVGAIRMRADTLIIDSLVAWNRGSVRIEGGLGLTTLTEPSFDLRLTAQNARILDNESGTLLADGRLRMTGPWEGALITGDMVIRSGVYLLAEDANGGVIDLSDPRVLRDIDPLLLLEEADALPQPSPLLENLRADVNVRVLRDTWIRSPEANVEIFSAGDLQVEMDRGRDLLTVEGVVSTDRGEYTFLGRRFLISRGSVTFIGGERIDPLLQIVAEHEVRTASPFEIQVVIGGTLSEPQVTLESNAQPPISQTDLLSYIAFGRQAGSLLQLQGSSGFAEDARLTGGRVIGMATQQMAGVAMGVLVSELERTAGRTLGAEVINITPADIPNELVRGAHTREILRGTEVEVGRYLDTRTFVAVQSRLYGGTLGVRVSHRLPQGFRVETGLEPRFEISAPSLAERPTPATFNIFSLFLIREWRF